MKKRTVRDFRALMDLDAYPDDCEILIQTESEIWTNEGNDIVATRRLRNIKDICHYVDHNVLVIRV